MAETSVRRLRADVGAAVVLLFCSRMVDPPLALRCLEMGLHPRTVALLLGGPETAGELRAALQRRAERMEGR